MPEKLFNLSEVGRDFNETSVSKKDASLTFVTKEFTKYLITSPYQSKSGERLQGWPTFANETKIQEIGDAAARRVHDYKALQDERSYEKTAGYRSRASSGAMESMKEKILEPVIGFIRGNFRLQDARFEVLVQQLNELDLTGKTDEEFKSEIFQKTSDYCKKDRIPKSQWKALENKMFLGKEKSNQMERK